MKKTFKSNVAKLLAVVFIVTSVLAALNVNAFAATGTKKILCVGDSITQGNASFNLEYSYRYPLWKKLIDAGYDFEFVGAYDVGFEKTPEYEDYKGQKFSNKHHAKWGWTIQGITGDIDKSLESPANVPDIAIIYLGTNNEVQDETVEAKVTAMRALIEKLRAANANMTIYLGEPFQSWFGEMSKAYENLAKELNTEASPVIAIPQVKGWVDDPQQANACTIDWVHTSPVGDEKLAQRVFDSLKASFEEGTTQTPTDVPTDAPTDAPTAAPTDDPSVEPTNAPDEGENAEVKAPGKVKSLKLKNIKKKTIKVTFKKVTNVKVKGYKVVYSTLKKFTKGNKTKTKTIKSTSTKLTKLKKGAKYYVKVRAYRVVNDEKVYGAYSSAANVKVKK